MIKKKSILPIEEMAEKIVQLLVEEVNGKSETAYCTSSGMNDSGYGERRQTVINF